MNKTLWLVAAGVAVWYFLLRPGAGNAARAAQVAARDAAGRPS